MTLPDSYLDVHRYDAAVLQWGRRGPLVPCAVQARDVEILAALWRHHFLTTAQIATLWWPGTALQQPQRRLVRLFRAGLVERFRPYVNRGSYQWTYTLSRDGFWVARGSGALPGGARFTRRSVYDYRFALHDLQLNAWAIAYRALAADRFLAWHGEDEALLDPPEATSSHPRVEGPGRVDGLREPKPRTLHPDAAIEVLVSPEVGYTTLLVEFDRTQRPEKNYPKFRRYDAFLSGWWRHTVYADQPTAPHVLFVCQDERHLRRFLDGADHQVTGHHTRPGSAGNVTYPGRRRMLFVCEADAHRGDPRAWRLPPLPPDHRERAGGPLEAERLQLPAGALVTEDLAA
jgi:Replication-relaxation